LLDGRAENINKEPALEKHAHAVLCKVVQAMENSGKRINAHATQWYRGESAHTNASKQHLMAVYENR
jgi:hypothetical protein